MPAREWAAPRRPEAIRQQWIRVGVIKKWIAAASPFVNFCSLNFPVILSVFVFSICPSSCIFSLIHCSPLAGPSSCSTSSWSSPTSSSTSSPLTGRSISFVRTSFFKLILLTLHWFQLLALDRTTIVDPLCHRPIGFGHDCAPFQTWFFQFSLNSGSIDIMDSWTILCVPNFRLPELPLNAMALSHCFNCPGRKAFGEGFLIHLLLLLWLVVLSLFHLHFQVLPIFNSTTRSILITMSILIPIHLYYPIFRLPFLMSILLTRSFLRILLQLNLQRNSGRNSLDTLTYKKDVQMVYVISLFQGSFQCWLLQQDHRCFYPRQTLGTFTLVSVLPCRWKQQALSSKDLWTSFDSRIGVTLIRKNSFHFQNVFFGNFFGNFNK